ncbi:malto-oligosyltrehalose synthase [Uliginosibacterium sp. H3]|uniref:Malto-oligosyltrehalose synthase n=1 Tax=Uliginosibacterium silvisoli TaxID=3114758 RepID=A0ABU6K7J9_9RHOO|nr:malto-oligosyltrehalose synthase [Uliginosibacterium sp. H3]
MIPRATLRLQFRREFTLDDATRRLDQFAALGLSHVYASPLQRARSGSTYGYDVVDYATINPELGGEVALRNLAAGLRQRGMGLILDIVPNHMATSYENEWWRQVLEGGGSSPYAEYFDIDWQSPDPVLQGKVLAPFLGQPYGDALASGDLKLCVDALTGAFYIAYATQRFPLALRDYAAVLGSNPHTVCKRLAALFSELAPGALNNRYANEARRAVVTEMSGDGKACIEEAVAQYSAATPEGLARLHRLLERQHYRLAWWRNAAEEINWRRFFEVSDLVGMRADREEVFNDQHALIFRLYAEGIIDGVRVDHIDGLANPRTYCLQLREQLEAQTPARQALGLSGTPYIVVEKILSEGELLAADWRIDGNTGYDFMDEVASVLHDENGAAPLEALWQTLAPGTASFKDGLHAARQQLLAEHFVAEFEAVVNLLHRIARSSVTNRDVSRSSLRRALHALLVCFPAYRLYGEKSGRRAVNAPRLQAALQGAREMLRVSDHATLEMLDGWLGGEAPASAATEFETELRCRAMIKFQQLTPPLAAKSLEDTVFYRHGRLLSRNEVGSNPERLARSVDEFHQCSLERQALFPQSLLATASHDHKRGEDTRMRLAVLSELPQLWQAASSRWHAINAELRFAGEPGRGAEAPDACDEYMLYQMLIAAWPPGLQADDVEGLRALATRLGEWQLKAMREAKARSDWMLPNSAYEEASRAFIDKALGLADGEPATFSSAFVKDVASFVARIEVPGIINSLSQTLLRMTCPGIPDLYQGTDRWDFSLVDPDNRRAVTYDAQIMFEGGCVSSACASGLLEQWRDGRIKEQLISSTLNLRKRYPGLFQSAYIPLKIEGPYAAHALAFARHDGRDWAIVITTRLAASLPAHNGLPLVEPTAWEGTRVLLPEALQGDARRGRLADALLHRRIIADDDGIELADALAVWPVALITCIDKDAAR